MIKEGKGFVPVQYKILKLDAKYIISCNKRLEKKEKGTGMTEYYDVPFTELREWLTTSHGKSGLVSVGDNILFQKIREVKASHNGDEDVGGLTPNQQQRVAYEKMQSLRDEIKRLKIEINGNVNNTVKLKALENKMLELEEFLFVDDVINVYSKHKGTYNKFADKGFYYGGHKYVQRSAGSGNLKQHTVTFIREDINADVIKKIRVGFSYDIETSEILPPAKFGAYEGLTTSGSIFVRKPNVVVIPDFEYITFADEDNKNHRVYYVTKRRDDEGVQYDLSDVPFSETDKEGTAYLNSFDGMGLVDPDFIKEYWQKDLNIDYTPSAFIVRSIGVKGLLATFPFKHYAKDKGYTKILDIRYNGRPITDDCYIDIDKVDVILTESQWKYKKLYEDVRVKDSFVFDAYNNHHEALWGVQRYTPKKDKEATRLNYQLIQTSNIRDDEDISKIIEPTKNFLTLLAEGKPEYVLYSLLRDAEIQKTENEYENDVDNTDDEDAAPPIEYLDYDEIKTTTFNKALKKNIDLLNDEYVTGEIKKYIHSILDKAKYGKLYPEGNANYQFMISDPYALAQWAFNWYDWKANMPDVNTIGLVPPYHIYSNYWLNKGVSTVDACRSPMTDIAEHNILTVCNEENTDSKIFEEMERYFGDIYSGIIYSIHDLSTVKHSDSDFDGDIVLSMDSKTFINNTWKTIPVTYDKKPDEEDKPDSVRLDKPQKFTSKMAKQTYLQGFGNKVGVYSNLSTSIFGMMPMFADGEKHSDPMFADYDCTEKQLVLHKKEKKLRYIIGEEIDSTKTGRKPEMSADFELARLQKDDVKYYNQAKIEEEVKRVLEANELVPFYKPYFFIYARENYRDKYTAYKSRMNDACKWLTYTPVDSFVRDVMHKKRVPTTEEEKFFWKYYKDHSPLLHTDCLMNKICWELEKFERELDTIIKEKWKTNSRYILMSYADDTIELSRSQEKFIKEKYDEYTKGVMSIFNKRNTDNGENSLYRIGLREALIYKIRTELTEKLGVGYTKIFDMLVKVLKNHDKGTYSSKNRFIWHIMGEDIINVIPENKKDLVWRKPISGENSVNILGEDVVFEWKERSNGEN